MKKKRKMKMNTHKVFDGSILRVDRCVAAAAAAGCWAR